MNFCMGNCEDVRSCSSSGEKTWNHNDMKHGWNHTSGHYCSNMALFRPGRWEVKECVVSVKVLDIFLSKRPHFKECYTPLFADHEDDLKSSYSGQSDNCTVCTFSCTNQEQNKNCERHADKFVVHVRNTNIKHEQDVRPDDQNMSPEWAGSCSVEAFGSNVERV